MRPLVVLLVLTAQFLSCFSQKTIISIGSNVPFSVAKRSEYLIKKASQYPVEVHPSDGPLPTLPVNSIFISLGNTATTRELISQSELNNLGGEAYIIRSQTNGSSLIIATDGNPHHEKRYQFNSSIGAAYGTYQTLELLGFAFLHPLDPFVPSSLLVPQQPINLIETPKWFHRAWHIHTQHPLELTDFLQGMDIETDYGYSEGWESMIHDWEKTLEWLVANLQNEVEWVLLLSRGWGEWGVGDIRKERLRMINNICHDFGMPCGVDVPIALSQQHSWRMIGTRHNPNAPIENDFEKIRENLDWWADANFDFVTTENGFSEFSSGSCTKMLEWMNYATKYAEEQHSMKMVIKVHISTGQTCEEYPDPITGEPINFNFLPIYADTRLGIMPHTVQFYALDDPAPTYGNDNFTFMYDFMFQQAGSGRSVIYYPETAYWVNYDNQVPLFLPIYALNRIRDIRMISKRQEQEKRAINGHCIFDSGWEWGYWLQDVVVARGSWNPQDQHSTDEKALVEAMKPFTKLFGKYESEISNLIVQLAVAQKDLLIYGKVNGVPPTDIEKRNGIAYLEGWDTWAEIGTTFESFLNTQPRHLGLNQFRFRLNTNPDYNSEVEPLLAEMDATFADLASKISVYETLVPIESQALLSEIIDGFKIVSNRATQVYALYDYASTWKRGQTPERKRRLETAQKAMTEAEIVIRRREKQYRTPLERIAGWRENPTVYLNTYLWNVKSLYYFWRDYDKAVHQSFDVMSPCYMNFINPIDVAIGEGYLLNATIALRKWADENRPGNHFIIDCAAAPLSEPTYPLPQSSVEYEFVEELKDDLNALKSSEDF